ncbi:MAG TPA: arsenate reductase ArsC [Candidatus Nanoarchaeia archaeon]|nr:arsenate reductase ArsC [Candidatus Nanoarchaeia archaeon]
MEKMRILFLCTHNSARSQLAEGLLRHLYGEKYEVFSAGTNPTQVHPLAIKVMAEIGMDISQQYSKNIEEFSNTDIDLAVTVCRSSSKTNCKLCSSPMFMGRPEIVNAKLHRTKNYLLHGFDDPSDVEGTEEERLQAFRNTRDKIKEWIIEEFADLDLESLHVSANDVSSES